MSRRKRNRQVAKELENQAVHNVEPVNEHKDINDDLYTITCGSIVIEATSMHPICVSLNNTLGFINAKDLKIGNRLVDYEGNIHEITSITCESVTDTFYNIEVENNHNYYVTENNILVHNKR